MSDNDTLAARYVLRYRTSRLSPVKREDPTVVPFLIELLVIVVAAVVVFLVAKYILGEAEADPPIRKIVLLILLVVFLVAILNLFTGHPLWGPVVAKL